MSSTLRADLRAKHAAIEELCRRYGVASLDLFGSGTTDAWRELDSDLDFVVTFRDGPTTGLADRYLGLAEDLEQLFGRRVDLITADSIRNPYFRLSVEASRRRIYAE